MNIHSNFASKCVCLLSTTLRIENTNVTRREINLLVKPFAKVVDVTELHPGFWRKRNAYIFVDANRKTGKLRPWNRPLLFFRSFRIASVLLLFSQADQHRSRYARNHSR